MTVDERLGTYNHFYQTAEMECVKSKQYLATAYVITPGREPLNTDDQHGVLEVFNEPFPDLHDYVERYFRDLQARRCRY